MLPSSLRLSLRDQPEFFAQARRKRLEHLLVFYAPSSESAESLTRFAVIIKKSHGNAVQRAKFKRVVRSAVVALSQHHPSLITRSPAFNFVLMPLGRVQSQATYEHELQEYLESAFSPAH